jgi:3-oxoacyl-[acyl-carrier-protein] synthase-3
MHHSRIVGTGTYLPERIVTNDELVKETGIDSNDSWIRERTGIGKRRIAAPGEATSDMATAASKKALKMAGIRPEDVDMIICGTVTPDMPFPAAAVLVQAKLGAKHAACFDISAACAGSIYALAVGDSFIKSGAAKSVLVIGAELLTRIVDWKDRNTCVLFGDAAGAMVIVPETREGHGLLSTHLHTDGTQAEILMIPGGGSRKPFSAEVLAKGEQFVKMNGREVYRTAVRVLEQCSREALERNGVRAQDVTHVIAHQANLRILEGVLKRLEIPLGKCHLNIEEVGNTSSASVPLTLDQANRKGALKDGDLILMMAIGGGMAWGSALVRW